MNLLERLLGDPPTRSRAVRVPSPATSPPGGGFVPQETYIQVGVAQVHIQKLQAFLQDYSPLVYSAVRCQVGARFVDTSYVIDPRKDKSGALGRLTTGYQPVISPVPYLNSEVRLTVALFRLRIANFLPAAIRLLSSISEVVLPDFKMAEKLAGKLTQGVSDLLTDESSFVVGWGGSAGEGRPSEPGYTVITNHPTLDASGLIVVNDTLMIGDEPETAIPFTDADFVLLRVDALTSRADYLTVEPIAALYEKSMRAIEEHNADALTDSLGQLRRAVMSTVQFTLADAKRIVTALTTEIRDRWESQAMEVVQFKKAPGKSDVPDLKVVSESDFLSAMNWAPLGRSSAP